MQKGKNGRSGNRSLKKLREIIGGDRPMTQKQFAAMVGVSLPLIKAVETGQLPLAKSLARKIEVATGAVFEMPRIQGNRFRLKPLPDGRVGYVMHLDVASDAPDGRSIPFDGVIRKGLGPNYTKECFDWHRRFFESTPDAAKLALEEVVPALREIFFAASKPGVAGLRHRLPAARASLWDWVAETNKAFRLGVKLPGGRR
jgi:hypothetical protein